MYITVYTVEHHPCPTVTTATRSPSAVLAELAHHARGCRARDEIAGVLEREATHATRSGDGYATLGRYDLAVAAKAFPPTDTSELESHPDDDAILEAGRALGKKKGSSAKKKGARKASARAA